MHLHWKISIAVRPCDAWRRLLCVWLLTCSLDLPTCRTCYEAMRSLCHGLHAILAQVELISVVAMCCLGSKWRFIFALSVKKDYSLCLQLTQISRSKDQAAEEAKNNYILQLESANKFRSVHFGQKMPKLMDVSCRVREREHMWDWPCACSQVLCVCCWRSVLSFCVLLLTCFHSNGSRKSRIPT